MLVEEGDTFPNQSQLSYISILSLIPGSYKQIKKSLIRFFLSAACSVIARWRQPNPPTLPAWACEMNPIEYLKYMVAWHEDKYDFHKLIWTVWNHFRYSSTFDASTSTLL